MKVFKVLLFAGDINVYSVARAFHEEYEIVSDVIGKFNSGPCIDSKIINYRADEKADEQERFLELVLEYADRNDNVPILLIGCGDSYLELISRNKNQYPKNVIAPYIDIDLMEKLIHKEEFYKICEEHSVDFPKTFVHKKEIGLEFDPGFKAPFILKPANGVMYWQHPFEGQNKVFKLKDYGELIYTLKKIYDSGYSDSIIIQDFIPGDDSYMRVLTNYSDKNAKVKMMCQGHVLLEEHTPKGIGNHAVILTEKINPSCKKIKNLLEKISYLGFSNLDIKYDSRDKKYKVFEINTRQGRSNYYVTGSGGNIAKYLVEDYINENEILYENIEEDSLWMVVPTSVAFRYVKSKEIKEKMRQLIREGKWVNPLKYSKDMNLKRTLKTEKSMLGQIY
ncbi:MAG: ATP-grasp domain-containing protein, partial [Anaerovoracaceae bacterium]